MNDEAKEQWKRQTGMDLGSREGACLRGEHVCEGEREQMEGASRQGYYGVSKPTPPKASRLEKG
ncbi:hypothetical protein ES702_00512 [subsurface metagenome]